MLSLIASGCQEDVKEAGDLRAAWGNYAQCSGSLSCRRDPRHTSSPKVLFDSRASRLPCLVVRLATHVCTSPTTRPEKRCACLASVSAAVLQHVNPAVHAGECVPRLELASNASYQRTHASESRVSIVSIQTKSRFGALSDLWQQGEIHMGLALAIGGYPI